MGISPVGISYDKVEIFHTEQSITIRASFLHSTREAKTKWVKWEKVSCVVLIHVTLSLPSLTNRKTKRFVFKLSERKLSMYVFVLSAHKTKQLPHAVVYLNTYLPHCSMLMNVFSPHLIDIRPRLPLKTTRLLGSHYETSKHGRLAFWSHL